MSNHRKAREPTPPNPECMPISRAVAVRQLAAHIADRTAFVISTPPAMLESAAHCLKELGDGDCYMDNGLDAVFRLSGQYVALAEVMAGLLPDVTAAVFTVPKTIPAKRLSEALQGHPIPEDGSQDLVLLHPDDNQVQFPQLLIEAIAKVDPAAVMQLQASDVRRMS